MFTAGASPNNTYKLLDSGDFQKLEQVGPYRLVRPAAQAVWRPRLSPAQWQKVDATFTRFSGGDGKWDLRNKKLPRHWNITTSMGQLVIEMTDFGHLGIFPEQHDNWLALESLIQARGGSEKGPEVPFKVLNLFAYTGGSSLAAAKGGAHVVHVDASKTSVNWARANAEAAGLGDKPIRWLVDDVQKFVSRELRRASQYHGIILDPPSYGRGPSGEAWKVEDHLVPMLTDLRQLLAPDYSFVLLSCHSSGYTPLALTNLLQGICIEPGEFLAQEMVLREEPVSLQDSELPAAVQKGRPLPSGASCLFTRNMK
jgi:23S rRNA (cytosine1962-C5)-methyltransferase